MATPDQKLGICCLYDLGDSRTLLVWEKLKKSVLKPTKAIQPQPTKTLGQIIKIDRKTHFLYKYNIHIYCEFGCSWIVAFDGFNTLIGFEIFVPNFYPTNVGSSQAPCWYFFSWFAVRAGPPAPSARSAVSRLWKP